MKNLFPSKHLEIISQISSRLADEPDYESHLQPLFCELAEAFDPNPYSQARRAIDALQTFCEDYGIRGVSLYLDNLYHEILFLEEQP